ncbi:hypothetical protein LCM08_26420 [Salipiger pacificus]|nr:hypothetical protein [Alloyangia pacifica]
MGFDPLLQRRGLPMTPEKITYYLETLMNTATMHAQSVAALQKMCRMSDEECLEVMKNRLERDRELFRIALRMQDQGMQPSPGKGSSSGREAD